jgi:hypothetical protein
LQHVRLWFTGLQWREAQQEESCSPASWLKQSSGLASSRTAASGSKMGFKRTKS